MENAGDVKGRLVIRFSFEASDGRVYSMSTVPYQETNAAHASAQAWSVCEDLKGLFGGLAMIAGVRLDMDPSNWTQVISDRKARIYEAVLHMQARRDGFELGPSVKSTLGEKIKILNEQNPGLDVTSEELLPIVKEFAQVAFEESFKPSRRERRKK